MKTTLDIQDGLPARAKRYAKKTGRPLRKVVEDGLREVLAVRMPRRRYRLPDSSVGHADAADPLEARSWPDLHGMIYGDQRHGRGWLGSEGALGLRGGWGPIDDHEVDALIETIYAARHRPPCGD